MRRYPPASTANSITALAHQFGPRPPHQGEPVKPAPVSARFTPGQQMALLDLRGNELCRAILETLSRSTAVKSYCDYMALADMGLARRRNNSHLHDITPQGQWMASRLAAELAQTFEIDPIHHTARTPGMYVPGVKARFNFW
jgi:hypothetical protein